MSTGEGGACLGTLGCVCVEGELRLISTSRCVWGWGVQAITGHLAALGLSSVLRLVFPSLCPIRPQLRPQLKASIRTKFLPLSPYRNLEVKIKGRCAIRRRMAAMYAVSR